MRGGQMALCRWAVLVLVVSLAGCASTQNERMIGTGKTAIATYLKKGIAEQQAAEAAKLDAALEAQKDLITRYAATFLSPQKADVFAAKAEEMIAGTRGQVQGVKVVRVTRLAGENAFAVVVQAREVDLRKSLGDGPEPESPPTHPFNWPDETGGGG